MPPPASNPPAAPPVAPRAAPPVAPPGRTPAWQVALFFPDQGEWSEAEYLRFNGGQRGIELVDGSIEALPMPTEKHQDVLLFLLDALRAFVGPPKLGKVQMAGLRVRLRDRNMREPDVVFMARENDARRKENFWEGADLAMEVVSSDDPDRDYVEKRREYAAAGIREYWIADPLAGKVVVLTLSDGTYREHGTFRAGEVATSVLLAGFKVDVSACLAAGE